MKKDKLTPEQEAAVKDMKKKVEEGFVEPTVDDDVAESVTLNEGKVWTPQNTSEVGHKPPYHRHTEFPVEVTEEVKKQVIDDLIVEKPPESETVLTTKPSVDKEEVDRIWGQDSRSRKDDIADLKGNIKGIDRANANRRDGETTNIKGEKIEAPKRKPNNVGGVFMMGGGGVRST